MLVDILTDGIFAAVAAIGFGAISDPPLRAFPSIALLAAIGHALRFCLFSLFSLLSSCSPINKRKNRYCFFQYRYGKFGSGKTHLLPHDCTLYSCIAAHDSGYVCLQNSILAHHVHAEPESARITGKVSD